MTNRFTDMLFGLSCLMLLPHCAHAIPTASVTTVGDLQSELGCPGDWQPDCVVTHLGYDAGDDVWQNVFAIPAGTWSYKAALNDSWTVNYGAYAQQNGANIALNLGSPTNVKFYYDDKSHWVTDNINSVIASVPGSFQSELGCAGDWDPGCLLSWLEDPDGNGLYSFSAIVPAGDYEAKVAIDESWDINYGVGGVQDGPNIPFSVLDNTRTTFEYNASSRILTITSSPIAGVPEPATLALLGLGLAGVRFQRKRPLPTSARH